MNFLCSIPVQEYRNEKVMRKISVFIVFFLLITGCSDSYNGELIFIEPDKGDSFSFPYYLFIPSDVSQNQEVYIVAEPNNSGFADDDLQKHKEKAERTATKDFYLGNYVARNLKFPLIVPVFPRQKTEWKIYTHALDRDVMMQKDNPLERIDEQLIEMFNDARIRLKDKNIETKDKFLITGFSASGTFANRFTLIHPDRVFAVAAGGVNGLLMLPLDSLQGEKLIYPVGTGDLNELSDNEFEEDLFLKIPQFYFMGKLDDNDAIPYDDAFDQNEREQIYKLLGKEMQPGRWNSCRNIYLGKNVNATIKTYEDIGHEQPELIKKDAVEFFRKSIEKDLTINRH
jgi:hypothetical protein